MKKMNLRVPLKVCLKSYVIGTAMYGAHNWPDASNKNLVKK